MMKELMVAAGMALSFAALAAGPLDNAVLHGETDKARAIDYALGEEMTFTLTLQGAKPFKEGEYFVKWTRTGDDGKKEDGKVDAKTLPLVVKTNLNQPGFVRLEAVVVDAKGASCWTSTGKMLFFDGGAGVRVDTLESVPEPKDFDEFWAKRKARLAKVPMTAVVKEHKSDDPAVRVLSFSVACAGPRPVTGWVTVPTDATKKYPASILFHGYGAHFIQSIPKTGPKDEIHMFINAHGYELEREEEYYTEFYNAIMSNGKTFGLDSEWQNKSTDTAYFGWMCYRIMRALQYLKSFPEWNGKDLIASGGSMGGLQTMWAAGLDPDVSEAKLYVPWCCDMGGRKTLKRNTLGTSVDETAALRYFDPVNMAKRVNSRCRVDITRAGLGDYICPPSGIAVLYNNLKCRKRISWVQGSTHDYVPTEKHQDFSVAENWN